MMVHLQHVKDVYLQQVIDVHLQHIIYGAFAAQPHDGASTTYHR